MRIASPNVAWVRIWPGVICGLSLYSVFVLFRGIFLRVLWFFNLHKNQHLQMVVTLTLKIRVYKVPTDLSKVLPKVYHVNYGITRTIYES